jgi:hypothetical protein
LRGWQEHPPMANRASTINEVESMACAGDRTAYILNFSFERH